MSALRITAIYTLFAGLWIFASDRILAIFVSDFGRLQELQTVKGMVFVSVTALLLFWLLSRELELRQRATESLRLSNETLSAIFLASPLAIYMLGLDGRVEYWNPASEKMFGWSQQEVIGKLLPIVQADRREQFEALVKRVTAGEAFYNLEIQRSRKDGSPVELSLNAAPLTDGTGQITRVVAMAADITERKRTEERLRRFTEIMKAIFQASPLAIYIMDLDGRIDLWNPAAEQIYGYKADEVIDQPLPIVDPEHKAEFETLLQRIGGGEVISGLETRRLRKDGTLLDVSLSIAPLTAADGKISRIMAIAMDITERKRVEAEIHALNIELEQRVLERTTQLQKMNRELETFTYSVSHDLKAPLRGIDGYSRLLLDEYSDRLDEEGKRFLATIRKAADHMNQLIEDLLAYSRLERRTMTSQELDCQQFLGAILAECQAELDAAGIRLRVNNECSTVIAEAEGLALVFRNLLDNAIKFTQNMPEPVIEIGGQEKENTCLFWVKDNGIGFDDRYNERIFEIFQRLHRAEDYPGTGIGLAIVQKAVHRMNGRVWATSNVDDGSTFFVEIPKGDRDEHI